MSILDKAKAGFARKLLGDPKLKPAAWNFFYEGVNISRNRSWQPVRAQDSDQTAIPWVRTVLLSHARRLVANVGFVQGTVKDLQMFTLGPYGLTQKSLSSDTKWAKAADDFFTAWSRPDFCDVTGRHSFRDLQYLSLASMVVDGDFGLILTETDTGWPKVQFVEGHQIGNAVGMYPSSAVYDNDPAQPNLVDGVILDRNGRPIGYQVIDGDKLTRIDSAAFIHCYEPQRATGHRGVSHFGAVLNHLRDIEDTISYMKTQVKYDAHLIGWRTTINGLAGQNQWDASLNAGNKPDDVTLENMLAGHLPTMKPGEGLEVSRPARPSNEAMALIDYLESDTLECLGLPASWKHLKVEGGATLRAALIRAQYRFLALQQTLIEHEFIRLRNWVLAKAAKRGNIPPLPDDWQLHTWKGPAHLTADVAKVNKENREDIAFGLRSPQRDAAEEGQDYQTIRNEVQDAAVDLIQRAESISKAHPWVDPQLALHLMSKRDQIATRVTENENAPTDKQVEKEISDKE